MSYQPVWNKVLQCVSCLDPCLKISRGNPAKMNSCIWCARLLNTWTSWKFSCQNWRKVSDTQYWGTLMCLVLAAAAVTGKNWQEPTKSKRVYVMHSQQGYVHVLQSHYCTVSTVGNARTEYVRPPSTPATATMFLQPQRLDQSQPECITHLLPGSWRCSMPTFQNAS